jgi:estrogen-related receptor beta like 1
VIIQPKYDPSEWKLEVERVTPLLRVQIANDNKDWRIHLDQITRHHSSIIKLTKSAQENLLVLHKEIDGTLEKIASREKYINQQFETQTQEFRAMQESNSEIKQKQSTANTHVSELTNDLSRVSEELESVKTRIDDIGTGMTDSKPLVNLKQGYSRLKGELKQMDLRMGVVRHSLLAAQMRNKSTNGILASPMFALHA